MDISVSQTFYERETHRPLQGEFVECITLMMLLCFAMCFRLLVDAPQCTSYLGCVSGYDFLFVYLMAPCAILHSVPSAGTTISGADGTFTVAPPMFRACVHLIENTKWFGHLGGKSLQSMATRERQCSCVGFDLSAIV